MISRRLIPILLVYLAVWSFPVVRAFSFVSEARGYYSHAGSIDASDDLAFAYGLIIAYVISLTLGLLSIVLAAGKYRGVLLAIFMLAILVPLSLLWLKPEEPIVFFPRLMPRTVVLFAVFPLISALMPRGYFTRHCCEGHAAKWEA